MTNLISMMPVVRGSVFSILDCRKDMLDEALLRPGRLEVQIEIGLPDQEGRQQILKASYPLYTCSANTSNR